MKFLCEFDTSFPALRRRVRVSVRRVLMVVVGRCCCCCFCCLPVFPHLANGFHFLLNRVVPRHTKHEQTRRQETIKLRNRQGWGREVWRNSFVNLTLLEWPPLFGGSSQKTAYRFYTTRLSQLIPIRQGTMKVIRSCPGGERNLVK